ncbi:putative glycophosphotransferase [Tieghemostelium lacteum]|uniref:Putative glycophosphotransferase n=1 Tax=Tieghemostelium lacteum TaxID=361077 RepID=A0A151Z3R2_TIELA|nr:putative glycophosphotransferase [Tieghemostelium lacteum]|eukprot:KYQ88600.1 putative glycophosphotransferase [Tieghemostelium lacteum]
MQKKFLILSVFIFLYVWISVYKYYHYVYNEEPIDVSKPLLDCTNIDLVYTWVNGTEPIHMISRMKRLNITLEEAKADSNRFRDLDGLKYSLRSFLQYAPWIRNVYIITDNQYPNWLNLEKTMNIDEFGFDVDMSESVLEKEERGNHEIRFIFHSDYFQNQSDLPVFNSNAIEVNYYSLPDEVSECFISMNDDVYFGAPVKRDDFVHPIKGILTYEDSAPISAYDDTQELFAQSLRHSNSLLNKLWGVDNSRHLAEHGPILFHKKVFEQMYKWIGDEMRETSSHAIRKSNDLQLPFLHLHFTKRFFRSYTPKKSINKYAGLIDDLTKMKSLFKKLAGTDYKTVCLNDGLSASDPNPQVLQLYHKSLNEKFPNKGYWEY